MDRIYLIGMMYAGKSTVGPLLAQRMQWSFRDLDQAIETFAKESVNDLFKNQGEEQFRRIESRVLRKTILNRELVLATGGGVIMDRENRKWLRTTGMVIFLQADVNTLYQRLSLHPDRPLLNGSRTRRRIMLQSLLASRQPLYFRTAHLVINTVSKTPEHITDEIFRKVAGK